MKIRQLMLFQSPHIYFLIYIYIYLGGGGRGLSRHKYGLPKLLGANKNLKCIQIMSNQKKKSIFFKCWKLTLYYIKKERLRYS